MVWWASAQMREGDLPEAPVFVPCEDGGPAVLQDRGDGQPVGSQGGQLIAQPPMRAGLTDLAAARTAPGGGQVA